MVIYTPLTLAEIEPHLDGFDIGRAFELSPLEGGTTNSNFRLATDKGNYVLTILEPDEEAEQIGWLRGYLEMLHNNNLPVPRLLEMSEGEHTFHVKGKKAILVPLLKGRVRAPCPDTAFAAGAALGKMNSLSDNYPHLTPPPWGVAGLTEKRQQIHEADLKPDEAAAIGVFDVMASKWQSVQGLPMGVVHSDLFPDNVLFEGSKVTGVIDFYKAGHDALAYDLAMGLLAWGFDEEGDFNCKNFKRFYSGYACARPLSAPENEALCGLMRRACATIILMRVLRRQTITANTPSPAGEKSDITPQVSSGIRPPLAFVKRMDFIRKARLDDFLNG